MEISIKGEKDMIDKYKNFVIAALNRAIRTICQTAVAVIGTSYVIADVDWGIVASASLLAGILSLLTSIATSLPEAEYMDWQEAVYDDDIVFADEEEGDENEEA